MEKQINVHTPCVAVSRTLSGRFPQQRGRFPHLAWPFPAPCVAVSRTLRGRFPHLAWPFPAPAWLFPAPAWPFPAPCVAVYRSLRGRFPHQRDRFPHQRGRPAPCVAVSRNPVSTPIEETGNPMFYNGTCPLRL
jgi:hypothetical protein